MRRGSKPGKSKEAKPTVSRKSPMNDASRIGDLEKRLQEAQPREAEALARETATGDILRVMNRSPVSIQPVLDALAETAARLCQATDAAIFRVEGVEMRLAAHSGSIATPPVGHFTMPVV